MFCTTCGNNLPDDAMFCGKCGTHIAGGNAGAKATNNQVAQQVAIRTAQPAFAQQPMQQRFAAQPVAQQPIRQPAAEQQRFAPQPAQAPAYGQARNQATVLQPVVSNTPVVDSAAGQQSVETAAKAKFSPLTIVGLVLAAVALLLALMPWVNVNSSLVSAGSVANGVAKGVSSLTGANTGDWSFKSGYSPMQFVDLGNTVSNYEGAASTLKSVLGSSKSSSDQGTSNTIYLTFGLWLLCFGVTVAGGIATFFSHKRNPVALAFGLSLLTLFSFGYVIMYFSFGSFVSDKIPLFAYLCGLVAAAGTICSFTAFWQRN